MLAMVRDERLYAALKHESLEARMRLLGSAWAGFALSLSADLRLGPHALPRGVSGNPGADCSARRSVSFLLAPCRARGSSLESRIDLARFVGESSLRPFAGREILTARIPT